METVKNLLEETAEKLRAIAYDSKDSVELRSSILILADEMNEKSVEFDPDYVKVCSSEYPEEGHSYILKEDYQSQTEEWTIIN